MELQELTAADEALQGRLGGARRTLAGLREERDRLGQARDEAAQQAADLRAARSGLASRIEVLEGLERSREGFGVGAREVFALTEQPEPGPWRTVAGIVADFLTVRREYAPLIDLALGDRAQRFLVRDPEMLGAGACASGRSRFPAASASCRWRRPGWATRSASRLPLAERAAHHPPLAERAVCRGRRRRKKWSAATTRSWPTCRVGCWAAP